MRQDFRVKMDFSRIHKDVRQHSLVYIDSSKILYVNQLADHVQRLFDIKRPFHLLSRFEETYFFIPFEEDVRVLQNDETILIVPGTGINNNHCQVTSNGETSYKIENNFIAPTNFKATTPNSEKSYTSDKSNVPEKSSHNTLANSSDTVSVANNSLYRTALHESVVSDIKDIQMTEDNFTEDASIIDDSVASNKRKRVRKRKQKKIADLVPESDASVIENTDKKPKIIDSFLISSEKHIRFKVFDDEDTTSDSNIPNGKNCQKIIQNGDIESKQFINKDLCTLLNMRHSSTPIAFSRKRIKRECKQENNINENGITVEANEPINKTNSNLSSSKLVIEGEKSKDNSQLNKSNLDHDDTVSFKVFRIGDDYTPQLSNVILAKVLAYNNEAAQYTLKILHGKEQLEDPEGKFSLPKDEDESVSIDDIVTLEKSKLLELTKVKAM